MDSEHRHELKTNELADWLTHLPEYLKRNATTIIGIVLIIIGLVTWPMFNRMRAESDLARAAAVGESIQTLESKLFDVLQAADRGDVEAQQQATTEVLVNANALLEQADTMKNPDQAALARIKAAQALRTELHFRGAFIDSDELHTRIGQAQDAYEKALAAAATPTLQAMAQLGLGLCAEELGQRDAAAAIYRKIMDNDDYASTVFPAQARQRLDGLARNLESVAFKPTPAAPAERPELPELPVGTGAPSPFDLPLLEADELPLDIPGITPDAPPVDEPVETENE